MHVRRGQCDVAQARRAELAHVVVTPGEFGDPAMSRRVGPLAVFVVEAGVVKTFFGKGEFAVLDVIGEVETGVAVVAFHLFAKEERFAALGCRADGIFILAVFVTIVGRS